MEWLLKFEFVTVPRDHGGNSGDLDDTVEMSLPIEVIAPQNVGECDLWEDTRREDYDCNDPPAHVPNGLLPRARIRTRALFRCIGASPPDGAEHVQRKATATAFIR